MFKYIILILLTFTFITTAEAEKLDLDRIVPIICKIESNNNPIAKNGDHYGIMQISPLVLKDYNKFQIKKIPLTKLFNKDINIMIGKSYLNLIWYTYLPYYHIEQNYGNLIIAWNFGIGNLVKYRQGKVKLPKETKNYLIKFNKMMREVK